jgi:hypothetical protein
MGGQRISTNFIAMAPETLFWKVSGKTKLLRLGGVKSFQGSHFTCGS